MRNWYELGEGELEILKETYCIKLIKKIGVSSDSDKNVLLPRYSKHYNLNVVRIDCVVIGVCTE